MELLLYYGVCIMIINLMEPPPLPKVMEECHFESDREMKKEYWSAIGYLNLNNFAIRVDVFERVFYIARTKNKNRSIS